MSENRIAQLRRWYEQYLVSPSPGRSRALVHTAVPELLDEVEALRAKVADYEQRGMGKLDGWKVEAVGTLQSGGGIDVMLTKPGEPCLKLVAWASCGNELALLAPVEKGGGG